MKPVSCSTLTLSLFNHTIILFWCLLLLYIAVRKQSLGKASACYVHTTSRTHFDFSFSPIHVLFVPKHRQLSHAMSHASTAHPPPPTPFPTLHHYHHLSSSPSLLAHSSTHTFVHFLYALQAEATLQSMETQPGFYAVLLEISCRQEVPLQPRMLAVMFFKNRIVRCCCFPLSGGLAILCRANRPRFCKIEDIGSPSNWPSSGC